MSQQNQQDQQNESETYKIQIPSNSASNFLISPTLTTLNKNFHSEAYLKAPEMISKMTTKITNNESSFQIFRPKGDLQIPKDGEILEKKNPADEKYKIYQKLIKPLQGNSFYSYKTLQMKLEMDLLLNEYFDTDDLLN